MRKLNTNNFRLFYELKIDEISWLKFEWNRYVLDLPFSDLTIVSEENNLCMCWLLVGKPCRNIESGNNRLFWT